VIKRVIVLVGVVIACGLAPAAAEAQSPDVSVRCNSSSQCEGVWFRGPVFLDWTVRNATAWTQDCVDDTISDDTPGLSKLCTAWNGTQELRVPLTIKIDKTPPVVSVAADRAPDHAGWYTQPVTFSLSATDQTSGVAGCDPLGYAGPDVADATVTGICRDRAGNVGSHGYKLSYDATPPDVGAATTATGDRVVRLAWPAGPRASVTRTPGIDGRAGSVVYEGRGSGFTDRKVRNRRRYRYVLTLTDQAGNTATRELAVRPQRALITPARRATVSGPPLLTWTPVRNARYYNVQLFRDGRKILSKWPKQARLQLKAKWRYRGQRYRLKPGVYKWYVWPGKGPREARKYGRRIGRRSFTVV
jgi:hypothetical protein